MREESWGQPPKVFFCMATRGVPTLANGAKKSAEGAGRGSGPLPTVGGLSLATFLSPTASPAAVAGARPPPARLLQPLLTAEELDYFHIQPKARIRFPLIRRRK